MTEEALAATKVLVLAAGYEVPVSKKGYLELVRSLVNSAQGAWRRCAATAQKLAAREARLKHLELKVQFLANDAGLVPESKITIGCEGGEYFFLGEVYIRLEQMFTVTSPYSGVTGSGVGFGSAPPSLEVRTVFLISQKGLWPVIVGSALTGYKLRLPVDRHTL